MKHQDFSKAINEDSKWIGKNNRFFVIKFGDSWTFCKKDWYVLGYDMNESTIAITFTNGISSRYEFVKGLQDAMNVSGTIKINFVDVDTDNDDILWSMELQDCKCMSFNLNGDYRRVELPPNTVLFTYGKMKVQSNNND